MSLGLSRPGLAEFERRIEELRHALASSAIEVTIARDALLSVIRDSEALASSLRKGEPLDRDLIKSLGEAARVVRQIAEQLETFFDDDEPLDPGRWRAN